MLELDFARIHSGGSDTCMVLQWVSLNVKMENSSFAQEMKEKAESRRIERVKMVHQVVMFICKMELGSKLFFLKEKRLLLLESVGWGVRKLFGMQNGSPCMKPTCAPGHLGSVAPTH